MRERGTLGRDPAYMSTSVLREDDIGGVYEVATLSMRLSELDRATCSCDPDAGRWRGDGIDLPGLDGDPKGMSDEAG